MNDDDLDELTPELRKTLDGLTYAELASRLGLPVRRDTTYATGQGYWRPGDGQPAVVFDGPADANAAGRCVANRVRYGTLPGISAGSIHPAPCGWCDYPKAALLEALDHAAWRSQCVATEFAVWVMRLPKDGPRVNYIRSTERSGEYDNPAWQAFYAQDRALRAAAIEAAAGYERVAAR